VQIPPPSRRSLLSLFSLCLFAAFTKSFFLELSEGTLGVLLLPGVQERPRHQVSVFLGNSDSAAGDGLTVVVSIFIGFGSG